MTDPQSDGRVPGGPVPPGDAILETAAGMTQDFTPMKSICAYLNAFHMWKPSIIVHIYLKAVYPSTEAVAMVRLTTADVRQCILYDSPDKHARLIGVEYMITPKLYSTLSPDERRLWHSHVYEVKSGELIMPKPVGIPEAVWEMAETKEMESVIQLYGKTYHLWQVDRGDKIPLGEPKLMMSCTQASPDTEKLVNARDEKFGTDHKRKAELRNHIKEPNVHPDADQWDRSKLT